MHLVRLHSMTKPSCLTHTLFILAGVHLTMSGDSSLCEKAEIALDSSGRMVLTDCHNSTTLGDVVDRIAQLENSNSANLTELQRVVAEQASTIAQLTAWMSSFDPHATAKAIKRHNQQVYSCYIDSPRVLDATWWEWLASVARASELEHFLPQVQQHVLELVCSTIAPGIPLQACILTVIMHLVVLSSTTFGLCGSVPPANAEKSSLPVSSF
eukprot:m.18598 g.18598  ORF g.18598 m.18598 type:complete len:212 (+) comp10134_c0_seq2:53-688(+)